MEEQGMVLATPTLVTQSTRQPWERLSDEPTRWYDCFLVYRNLGTHRSIISAYKEYRKREGCADTSQIVNASGDWYKYRAMYDWDKRAALYDDYIIRQVEAEAEQAVREWYAKSRFDLIHIWDDLKVEYDMVENGSMSKSQVTQAMKTISQLTTPTSPTQSIDVQIILDKLPPDVQTALLDSLSKS